MDYCYSGSGTELHSEDMVDPSTGILLTPSFHGEHCLGSGDHPGFECCCDECDYYLTCFPDWRALQEMPLSWIQNRQFPNASD